MGSWARLLGLQQEMRETTKRFPRIREAFTPASIQRFANRTLAAAQQGDGHGTGRSVVIGLLLALAAFLGTHDAHAKAKSAPEKSLYERLGGIFAIAAVVDHFSDAIVKNPVVGQKSKNGELREWHTKNLKRLPGLKFMRTL
jgi:hypothetical protein